MKKKCWRNPPGLTLFLLTPVVPKPTYVAPVVARGSESEPVNCSIEGGIELDIVLKKILKVKMYIVGIAVDDCLIIMALYHIQLGITHEVVYT